MSKKSFNELAQEGMRQGCDDTRRESWQKTGPNSFNALPVRRVNSTIHIPLPREAWAEIDGGCACLYCSADGKPAPAHWDTLALGADPSAQSLLRDTTWTCHAPEYHGARKRRAE